MLNSVLEYVQMCFKIHTINSDYMLLQLCFKIVHISFLLPTLLSGSSPANEENKQHQITFHKNENFIPLLSS